MPMIIHNFQNLHFDLENIIVFPGYEQLSF